MAEIPADAIALAMAARAHALADLPDPLVLSERELTRQMLAAAAPILERHLSRKLARDILALDEEDRRAERAAARNAGPYGDLRTSLRRLARGEPLPAAHELRGRDTGD